MPVARTHGSGLKTDEKGPDQPEYLKDSQKTSHCVSNSSIYTFVTVHGIASKTVLVDYTIKSVRFNSNVQVN